MVRDVAERMLDAERIIAKLGRVEYEVNSEGQRSLVLRSLAPGVSIHQVVEAAGVPVRIPPELIRPGSTL